MPSNTYDPADPHTWPVWMRESDICTQDGRVGPFPATDFQWRKLAPPPVKFGTRIACWHRNTVAEICKLPLPDPVPEQPQTPEPAATGRAAVPATQHRNKKERTTRHTAQLAETA